MTLPLSNLLTGCGGSLNPVCKPSGKSETRRTIPLGVLDAVIGITALVVGILGILGTIQGMPPAAAYTLIGVGCAVPVAYLLHVLAGVCKAKCKTKTNNA